VFRLNPRNGCQDKEGLGKEVLAKRNLVFFEKMAQLISILLKKGLGFLLICLPLGLHRKRDEARHNYKSGNQQKSY